MCVFVGLGEIGMKFFSCFFSGCIFDAFLSNKVGEKTGTDKKKLNKITVVEMSCSGKEVKNHRMHLILLVE